jgi:hypothetical protein
VDVVGDSAPASDGNAPARPEQTIEEKTEDALSPARHDQVEDEGLWVSLMQDMEAQEVG